MITEEILWSSQEFAIPFGCCPVAGAGAEAVGPQPITLMGIPPSGIALLGITPLGGMPNGSSGHTSKWQSSK